MKITPTDKLNGKLNQLFETVADEVQERVILESQKNQICNLIGGPNPASKGIKT